MDHVNIQSHAVNRSTEGKLTFQFSMTGLMPTLSNPARLKRGGCTYSA